MISAIRQEPGDSAVHMAPLKLVAAEASLLAALMFYFGAIYTGRYYAYFQLSPLDIGLSFTDFVLQSTRVLTEEVAWPLIFALVAISIPASLRTLPSTRRLWSGISSAWAALARYNLALVAVGLAIFAAWIAGWEAIYPYVPLAFALIAAGLLLGQSRAAQRGARPRNFLGKGIPVLIAVFFLVWGISLFAAREGTRKAVYDAQHIEERTAVVVFSTQRLSLQGPGVEQKDLGEKTDLRYRYTGLRLLAARNGRYFVVPLGWNPNTSSTFVFRETDDTRIELRPGVRRA
ncbi:hypothetical protein ACH347_34645 [Saccharopolyspora sp. 5N102]|uniref:hypothetical protein n=1 Tax=Saccharopolyspora sp. 5N102 TaxID=3375155 RepID=UPI003787BB90